MLALLLALSSVSFLQGCTPSRKAVCSSRVGEGEIAGFAGVRMWEVEYKPDITIDMRDSSDCSFLVLSGGGSKGAFGAGFLNGWSDTGTRPEFKLVTGISTGALIAPLAFLGPSYDDFLAESYTTVTTKDILNPKGLLKFPIVAGLTSESIASAKPLEEMIQKMITPQVMEAIAQEHEKGRRLYVGTTNLDAQRLVAWDMGAIASTRRPDAIDLFRKVLLASASIPGEFPPVYFPVEIDGEQYDEMHVDGGVIAGLFGYSPSLFSQPQPEGLCSLFILKNGKLDTEPELVNRSFFAIAGRSIGTLMKAQSWNDIIRLRNQCYRDGVSFHYAALPYDFASAEKEMFDMEEMKRMYKLGYQIAVSDRPWQTEIPLFHGKRQWLWTSESPGTFEQQ